MVRVLGLSEYDAAIRIQSTRYVQAKGLQCAISKFVRTCWLGDNVQINDTE